MATPAANPQSEAGLKENFYTYFQQEVSSLQSQIDALNTNTLSTEQLVAAIDDCLAGIDRLSHEVKDAASYIPAYDRRSYGDTIKSLSEKLQTARNHFAPPKKFSFKSGRKTKPQPQAVPGESPNTAIADHAASSPNPLSPPQQPQTSTQSPTSPPTTQPPSLDGIYPSNATSISISDKSRAHISLPPSASTLMNSATISRITHSVIDLSTATTTSTTSPLASLILKDISNSLILSGPISGPIHMTNITNSVLVTACRQFRMHECNGVDVYLHCASRPIIEDCRGIRFAELPEICSTATLTTTLGPNHWNQIDDFKWLKLEPSPHFCILEQEKRVQDSVWESINRGNVMLENERTGADEKMIVVDMLKTVGVLRAEPQFA